MYQHIGNHLFNARFAGGTSTIPHSLLAMTLETLRNTPLEAFAQASAHAAAHALQA
jgi:hypothetical protein